MRIEWFLREVDRILESIQEPEQWILLSKVIGNNHRQSFVNQLMIYDKCPKEYGISLSAINKWVKRYSEIKTEDGDIFTAAQIKELQKRNAQPEEENLILKKAIAIFTPHSSND